MCKWVGEPGAVRGWDLLLWGLYPRNALQGWLLLPCGVYGYDAVPCGVSLRIFRPFKPHTMSCWELLSSDRIESGGLRAGQLLSPGLLQPDIVRGGLLLPQHVCSAAVRGGLRVR